MANTNKVIFDDGKQIIAGDISEALLVLRKQLHLTQTELAKKAKTDQGSISRVERGALNPTINWISQVAESVGYTAEFKFKKNDGGNQNEDK
ncbi:helix-turn-helix domain-containing protein [Lacticaseibacillus paracasei]|uniref:helix-turn-helix domain-containing protein n=1 Tax=Lacticaseibacillus paracasei TaxID=1597 RepID=UPI0034E88CBB